MESGDILHLEFQSQRERTLYRFLSYDVALAERFDRKEAMGMTDVVRELMEEAEQEGWQKGLEQGRKEGLQQGRQEVALKLLAEGVSLDVVVKTTGLTREEMETLRRQIH